jgi:hypothetical protein
MSKGSSAKFSRGVVKLVVLHYVRLWGCVNIDATVGHERVYDQNYVFYYITMDIYVIGCTSTFSPSFCIHTINTKTCVYA